MIRHEVTRGQSKPNAWGCQSVYRWNHSPDYRCKY